MGNVSVDLSVWGDSQISTTSRTARDVLVTEGFGRLHVYEDTWFKGQSGTWVVLAWLAPFCGTLISPSIVERPWDKQQEELYQEEACPRQHRHPSDNNMCSMSFHVDQNQNIPVVLPILLVVAPANAANDVPTCCSGVLHFLFRRLFWNNTKYTFCRMASL